MPPRPKRGKPEPPRYSQEKELDPDKEEVFSINTVSDDTPPPPPPPPPATRSSRRAATAAHSEQLVAERRVRPGRGASGRNLRRRESSLEDFEGSVVTISDEEEEPDMKLEEVDIPARAHGDDEEELMLGLEEVDVNENEVQEDHSSAYAAAYEAAAAQQGAGEEDVDTDQLIFKDGKGQPGGISVSIASAKKAAALAAKKNGITTQDRQGRLAVHKWMVLCLLAHAKRRNRLLNDEILRDLLYSLVPNQYLEKLRAIHPKRVPTQNERVRLFEAFLRDIARWWSFKFRLEPKLTTGAAIRQPATDILTARPGKRMDGWIVETAKEREDRHRCERQEEKAREMTSTKARKGKGKAKVEAAEPSQSSTVDGLTKTFLSEITLFGTGGSTTPVFLRLAKTVDAVEHSSDLAEQAEKMSGSRETKAQLFACMCRALGIPSRLVISVQAPSWSVAAGKIASTSGATAVVEKSKVLKRKRAMKEEQKQRRQTTKRPESMMTSEEETGFTSALSSAPGSDVEMSVRQGRSRAGSAAAAKNGSTLRPVSVASTAAAESVASTHRSPGGMSSPSSSKMYRKGREKGKGNGKSKDEDYRGDRWKNLDAPLEVKYEPKLRIQKPKALKPGQIGADSLSDVEPVDVSAPPTMWVEVYSKPWQRWITVDPVRGMVEPIGNRHMEPSPNDKSNRLIYVVAFEEDGYARDVTARYTKTLHSRVSRMRPPPLKVGGGQTTDWWTLVVKAFHRPQKLDRDAVEDAELEGAAAREPMPSSVAAFKEHPVYTLEKHLRRDEVIFPAKQAGTFQGTPVFLRANVVACRSARQWYNQGRVVKEGEEALKWVKSRGYTIANKRAEEEARLQGQESLQEGLYAPFQTELYRPPPVMNGIVPTNSFGNIDLFVDSMLPEGAAHVPYSGAARVAKKLGINHAEAITGFEFRKHRSMPKLTGVVISKENEEVLLSALEEDQQATAEKEFNKKQERLFKNWKRLLNGLKIQERLQREYGQKEQVQDEDAVAKGEEVVHTEDTREGRNENLDVYEDLAEGEQERTEEAGGGGFMVD